MRGRISRALAFVFVPAFLAAQAPPPPHNAETTYFAGNPSGSCSAGRQWVNTSTLHEWNCVNGAWQDLSLVGGYTGGATTSPVLAPESTCATPGHAFVGDPDSGLAHTGGSLLLCKDGLPAATIPAGIAGPMRVYELGWAGGVVGATEVGLGFAGSGSDDALPYWKIHNQQRNTYYGGTAILTESSATLSHGYNSVFGTAGGHFAYIIQASDATDSQIIVGEVRWGVVQRTAGIQCSVAEVGTPLNLVSAGTLTNTWTCVSNPSYVEFYANAVSSLTQTLLYVRFFDEQVGASASSAFNPL